MGLAGIRVSIAGPAEVHDRLRPSARNGKTYEIILGNLSAVSDLAPITVECQYDPATSEYLLIPGMLDELKERGIRIDNIAFSPIMPTRGPRNSSDGVGDPRIFLYLAGEAAKRGYPQLSEAPSFSCGADFRSKLIFDTDGSIIPCPALQGGELAYGNVFTGIDFAAHSRVLKRDLPQRCIRDCELLPFCFGGCRFQAMVQGKSFSGVDCNYDLLKAMIESHIELAATSGATAA